MKFFKRFRKDESGATAIEYGLIAALITVAAIAMVQGLVGESKTPQTKTEQPLKQ